PAPGLLSASLNLSPRRARGLQAADNRLTVPASASKELGREASARDGTSRIPGSLHDIPVLDDASLVETVDIHDVDGARAADAPTRLCSNQVILRNRAHEDSLRAGPE